MGAVGGVAASVVISWRRNGEIHQARLDLPGDGARWAGSPGVGVCRDTRINGPVCALLPGAMCAMAGDPSSKGEKPPQWSREEERDGLW